MSKSTSTGKHTGSALGDYSLGPSSSQSGLLLPFLMRSQRGHYMNWVPRCRFPIMEMLQVVPSDSVVTPVDRHDFVCIVITLPGFISAVELFVPRATSSSSSRSPGGCVS